MKNLNLNIATNPQPQVDQNPDMTLANCVFKRC